MRSKILSAVLALLMLLCVSLAAFAGYKIYSKLDEYKVSRDTYEDIAHTAVSYNSPDPIAETMDKEERSPITIDFQALKEQNPDIVAWLYSEGTVIDYPVVYSGDNDYYLHRLFDGSYNYGGTIFLDAINATDFSDRNNILYGHNMDDGSMFESIIGYKRPGPQAYYDEHPVMYLNTPGQNYKVEIFVCRVTESNGYPYRTAFMDDADYTAWLEQVCTDPRFESDVQLDAESKILTLSTCSYEFDNARTVVMGKLTPIA